MKQLTWYIVVYAVLVALIAHSVRAAENEADFIPLFNGKNLNGWHKEGGGATYKVDGDSILGEVGPGSNTFLCTEKTYGDFILKLDCKLEVPGNSGIQLRSQQKDGNGRVFGYQCEIDPSARKWTAGIYDEGRRGWLYPLHGKTDAQNAFKLDDWNSFLVVACGPSIKTFVNGVPCADLIDTMDMDGFIALQVHSGKAGRIRWKNIRLKDLGHSTWSPLGDGRTLTGWRKSGGDWNVENGAIHGVSPASESRHGHLITDQQYKDFAIRLKFKAAKGNSGLYFRATESADGLQGFQAEIDASNDVGGLYETGGRAWVVQPKPEDVKKYFKPGQWNDMSVVALGKRLVVHVNGTRTADIVDEQGRQQGHIALQLHGGQDMDVSFKDIELMKLDGQKCD